MWPACYIGAQELIAIRDMSNSDPSDFFPLQSRASFPSHATNTVGDGRLLSGRRLASDHLEIGIPNGCKPRKRPALHSECQMVIQHTTYCITNLTAEPLATASNPRLVSWVAVAPLGEDIITQRRPVRAWLEQFGNWESARFAEVPVFEHMLLDITAVRLRP